MLYVTAPPKSLPINNGVAITGVSNADGSVTITAGAGAFAAYAFYGRPISVNVVAGSDTSISAANSDCPGIGGTPTAAQLAAYINAPVKSTVNVTPASANPVIETDFNYSALSAGMYGLWRTDGANVPHAVGTASPSAPIC